MLYSDVTDTPLFSGLTIDKEFVSCLFTVRRIAINEVLFQQNEIADTLGIVRSGQLSKRFESETRSFIVSYQRPGDVIGEAEAMHSRRRRFVTTIADEPSSVWLITRTRFDKLLVAYPELYQKIFDVIGDRFVRAGRKITYLALMDARTRIIQLLLNYVQDTKSTTWIVTQAQIGQLVNLNRESVARVLAELQQNNYIKLKRGRIKILNYNQLLEMVSRSYSDKHSTNFSLDDL